MWLAGLGWLLTLHTDLVSGWMRCSVHSTSHYSEFTAFRVLMCCPVHCSRSTHGVAAAGVRCSALVFCCHALHHGAGGTEQGGSRGYLGGAHFGPYKPIDIITHITVLCQQHPGRITNFSSNKQQPEERKWDYMRIRGG